MLLTGRILVDCPIKKRKVIASSKDGCARCTSFNHISYRGLTPLMSCGVEKKEDSVKRRQSIN